MTAQQSGSAIYQPAPPASFGRVADDGSVYLRLPDGSERKVGEWPDVDASKALEFFVIRYQDMITEIDLATKRLADDRSTPTQAIATIARVRQALDDPAFVGDLAALVARVGQLEVLVSVKRTATAVARVLAQEQAAASRALAQEQAAAAREQIITEAESLSGSTAWRVTTQRFRELVDQWKALPRSNRGTEDGQDGQWKRLSKARTTFDRQRKIHYSELEAAHSKSKEAKDKLVKEAVALSSSRDWAATTGAYRTLLDRWKTAGRAGKADDALWAKFKAAQDAFFASRNEVYDKRSTDERAALVVKEQLVAAAEALLPVKDIKSAKRNLRPIQEKFEKAGRVPRNDVKRIDDRMQVVEDAIRKTEGDQWKRTNPELKARASSTVERFSEGLAKLERQLAKAQESGNSAAIEKAADSLAGATQLLEAAQKGLADFS